MSLAIRQRHPFGTAYRLEQIGRATMDFGFAGLLTKFEEHFGRRATRWLLIIVGLAVVAVSLNLFWNKLLHPLVRVIDSAKPLNWTWESILQTGFYSLEIIACAGFFSTLIDAYRKRMAADEFEEIASLAQEAYAEAIFARKEGRTFVEDAQRIAEKATEAFGRIDDYASVFDLALEDLITCADAGIQPTPETIDLLRSLQDIVREKRL